MAASRNGAVALLSIYRGRTGIETTIITFYGQYSFWLACGQHSQWPGSSSRNGFPASSCIRRWCQPFFHIIQAGAQRLHLVNKRGDRALTWVNLTRIGNRIGLKFVVGTCQHWPLPPSAALAPQQPWHLLEHLWSQRNCHQHARRHDSDVAKHLGARADDHIVTDCWMAFDARCLSHQQLAGRRPSVTP